MRHWKRVVAVLAVAAVALVVEGWVARAQATPTLFKNCTYTRTAGEHGQPPYSLAPTLGLVKVTLRTNRGDLVLTLDRANAIALSNTPGRGNSSEFFITPADAPLSPTSTVLGRVTTGQPVLDRLTTSAPATLLEVFVG
ncbi:hypothetical protein ACWGID_18285 [Kribbella sp. NPDC054772]